MARPLNLTLNKPEADDFRLAASCCYGIVNNHPFVDGNKRTCTLAAVAFLALNEVDVQFDEPEIVVMVIGLASSEVTETEFADWLRKAAV